MSRVEAVEAIRQGQEKSLLGGRCSALLLCTMAAEEGVFLGDLEDLGEGLRVRRWVQAEKERAQRIIAGSSPGLV